MTRANALNHVLEASVDLDLARDQIIHGDSKSIQRARKELNDVPRRIIKAKQELKGVESMERLK